MFYKENVLDINESSAEMSKNSWSILVCRPLFLWIVIVKTLNSQNICFFKLYTSWKEVGVSLNFLIKFQSLWLSGGWLCGHYLKSINTVEL